MGGRGSGGGGTGSGTSGTGGGLGTNGYKGQQAFNRMSQRQNTTNNQNLTQTQAKNKYLAEKQNISGTKESQYEFLKAYAESKGWKVVEKNLPGTTEGLTSHSSKTISIQSGLPPDVKVRTMAHELGHAMLHPRPTTTTFSQREVQAESFASMVLDNFGAKNGASSPYINYWQNEPGGKAGGYYLDSSSPVLTGAYNDLFGY